jgi:hypothetical protein
MPVQVPPSRRHCQPRVLFQSLAISGYGSLNRSKTTASLPLNVFATPVQNCGAYRASGTGFWQVACSSVQCQSGPVAYAPQVQCRSRITLRPLATSRST